MNNNQRKQQIKAKKTLKANQLVTHLCLKEEYFQIFDWPAYHSLQLALWFWKVVELTCRRVGGKFHSDRFYNFVSLEVQRENIAP